MFVPPIEIDAPPPLVAADPNFGKIQQPGPPGESDPLEEHDFYPANSCTVSDNATKLNVISANGEQLINLHIDVLRSLRGNRSRAADIAFSNESLRPFIRRIEITEMGINLFVLDFNCEEEDLGIYVLGYGILHDKTLDVYPLDPFKSVRRANPLPNFNTKRRSQTETRVTFHTADGEPLLSITPVYDVKQTPNGPTTQRFNAIVSIPNAEVQPDIYISPAYQASQPPDDVLQMMFEAYDQNMKVFL